MHVCKRPSATITPLCPGVDTDGDVMIPALRRDALSRTEGSAKTNWQQEAATAFRVTDPSASYGLVPRSVPVACNAENLICPWRSRRRSASTRSFRQATALSVEQQPKGDVGRPKGGLTSVARTGPRIRTSAGHAALLSSVAARGERTLARDMDCLFRCPPSHRLSLRHVEHARRR